MLRDAIVNKRRNSDIDFVKVNPLCFASVLRRFEVLIGKVVPPDPLALALAAVKGFKGARDQRELERPVHRSHRVSNG